MFDVRMNNVIEGSNGVDLIRNRINEEAYKAFLRLIDKIILLANDREKFLDKYIMRDVKKQFMFLYLNGTNLDKLEVIYENYKFKLKLV